MSKFLLVISLVLMASAASAQQQGQQQGREACTRDAQRVCRAHLDQGDDAVLACLKKNRGRISKGCRETLTAHGH
jgi:hypothetical protein